MKLVLDQWHTVFEEKLSTAASVKIISPSCSMFTMEILAKYNLLEKSEFITRFSLYDFFVKLSDLKALRLAVENGMRIFGVKHLHCKAYIFNDKEAIISSSNFTWGGMFRNHECGILFNNTEEINELLDYFSLLKNGAAPALSLTDCDKWEQELSFYKADILTPYMMPDYSKEVPVPMNESSTETN
ncbi:phospholipase D family protein [Pseudobacter ginsenosidimutans]|uniref:Phospholipase D-like protein n=1 Tax=Pseudobacter ginsenosidimutans TaxID=661488 RepID=A0A4V2F241_9BACT|nr:phospholipase D family protein [Pseudobacter ginsenosidimutans]QEC44485.1 hypothetical protein FSB84_23435 [Pseudobacter ginsenosidimutans]RZS75957.1 phospholipase D-like protein [Pseudobacter ginsenosidimutans]